MIGQGDYNLFDHNYEHFAIWCKTDLKKLTQLSIEGLVVRFLKSKMGLLKWLADEI
jgi:hypothetical protein